MPGQITKALLDVVADTAYQLTVAVCVCLNVSACLKDASSHGSLYRSFMQLHATAAVGSGVCVYLLDLLHSIHLAERSIGVPKQNNRTEHGCLFLVQRSSLALIARIVSF